MNIISHRGNLEGRCFEENNPQKIKNVIEMGYDVEIDVRTKNNILYLGHDAHDHKIDISFLMMYRDKLWIHCKDLDSLENLSSHEELNIFWHQNDDFVLTKSGHIWTYPGKNLCAKSIAVMPSKNDAVNILSQKIYGICTDDVNFFKNLIK